MQSDPTTSEVFLSIGYLCVAVWQSWLQLPSSVIKPSQYNNLYSRYRHCSRVSWGHLRLTYCQHSLHRQTLLLVGSPHAASPLFRTVFPHLYALLTASSVAQDICSRFAVRTSDVHLSGLSRIFKFVTYTKIKITGIQPILQTSTTLVSIVHT